MTDVAVLQCRAMARQSMLGQQRVLFMNKTILQSFLNKFSEMNGSALETREFISLSSLFFFCHFTQVAFIHHLSLEHIIWNNKLS